MSSRSQRKKKARPTSLSADSEKEDFAPRKSRQVNKPKYVLDAERGDTPSSTRSQASTPDSSRPNSPAASVGRSSRKGRQPKNAKSTPNKSKKGGSKSGTATPISRTSRSSSVSSTAKKSRSKKSVPKLKIKTKLGRGYNPSLVNYKDSEYHYGSDFDDEEHEEVEVEQSSESSESEMEEDSDDMKPESDVELEPVSIEERDSFTPVPYWLQDYAEIPSLTLPKSSEDLCVDREFVFQAVAIYEVLRQFHYTIRLSPFRLEDFCMALSSEDQSNLLSEIHIALLKSLLREEDREQVQFGPLDQKDSMNVFLHFIDPITWPENLRFYLSADPVTNKEVLEILNCTEYPFTSVNNKIMLLSFLTNQFLSTSAVREDLVNEGQLPLEDHCRVCHKLGDMVVCELCNGPFHGTCLEPPLFEIPDEDFICPVCHLHQVEGVADCVTTDRGACRHDSLGIDRNGNKYWFACRRLWIEGREGDISYYSTKNQLVEVFEALDKVTYERELCEAIGGIREELESQMEITEKLTNEQKSGFKRTYLEMENAALEKLQRERDDLKEKEEEEQRKAQEDVDRQIREEGEERRKLEEEKARKEQEEEAEKKRITREEGLEKREEMRGDTFQDDFPDDIVEEVEPMEEVTTTITTTTQVITTSQVTSTVSHVGPSHPTSADLDDILDLEEEINPKQLREERRQAEAERGIRQLEREERAMEKENQFAKLVTSAATTTSPIIKRPVVPPGVYFKLGQEGGFKNYVNQYTVQTSALSRAQVKQEQEQRTRLSHKFSLTDVCGFKWVGATHGSRAHLVTTLRQTILQLENNIPTSFMHANWALLRKPWINAVTACSSPRDFSRAMTVLTCCVKQVVMLPVWTDALGHTQVKKISFQARDDKKKVEKRERKEREEEEEKMKPWMAWVKYTLPVKSLTVVRQKGEEYRAHGRNGWLWLSATRVWKPQDSRQCGLSLGPHRLAVKYTDLKNNTSKVVLMDPKAFAFLIKTQKERDDKALARMVSGEEEEVEDPSEVVVKTDEDKRRANLTKILDMSRIDQQEANEDDLGGPEGVVDVSAGVTNPTRLIYPRTAKKSSKLDDLLARRIQLRTLEERRIELQAKTAGAGSGTEGECDTKTSVTSDIVAPVKEELSIEIWMNITKKKLLNCVKSVRDAITVENGLQTYMCCSPLCQAEGPANCYSPSCRGSPKTSSLATAAETYREVCKEAKMYEVALPQIEEGAKFESVRDATMGLTKLVKMLLEKEKEVGEMNTMETVSTVMTTSVTTTTSTTTLVNGSVKSKVESTVSSTSSAAASVNSQDGSVVDAKGSFEAKTVKSESSENEQGLKRTYTVEDTSGALYLKRIQSVAEAKKTNRIVKYPVAPHFIGKSRVKRNILILGKHDIRRMARNFGQTTAEGFNYNAKANQQTWNYPCPRPTFRTTWLYRTAGMNSIHAVALQLRSIWICIRWDDMNTKQGNSDGKHQQTTESEIITTEILKHRNVGLFLERTQYFQRRISIPLDVPKKQVDYSPIRSGLRKRKRAESPVHAEPRVEETWIDEDNLELWEIKAYRDKIERERTAAITRRQGGREIKAPDRLDPSEEVKEKRKKVPADASDIKAKMEENLRQQREAFKAGQASEAKPSLSGLGVRKSGDGIKVMPGKPAVGGGIVMSQKTVIQGNMPFAKKIFMSKDGKVIGSQIANVGSPQQQKFAPPGKVAIPPTPPVVTPGQSNQQKVQIVKSADGKIQVRGLLPGQQLVQMPDGKLQIFSQSPSNTVAPGAKLAAPGKIITAGPGQVLGSKPVLPAQQQLLPKPSPVQQQPIVQPQKTYAIQRTPTQPIQPKPPTSTQLLNTSPPQLVVNKPAQMLPPTPAIPPTTPTIQTPAASPNKNMVVGIQSLGQNTVTIKDGQLMVQGPDHAAATAIARQLSSGTARLASLGGKQVLLSTSPAAGQQYNPPPQPPSETSPVAPSTITAPDSTVGSPPPQIAPPVPEPEPPPPPREPSPPPTPLTVTAQLVQTPQGPRIILQGLQGIQLEQHQLMTIQQTVKQQLLKQQALARQQGRVPPTKVSVPLPANIQPIRSTESAQPQQPAPQLDQISHQQLQQPEKVLQQPEQVPQQQLRQPEPVQQQQQIQQPQQSVTEPSTAPSPFPPQQQLPTSSPSVAQQQLPSSSPAGAPQQLPSSSPAGGQQPQLRTADGQLLPASLLKQGQIMMRNGQKVLVLPPAVLQQHQKEIQDKSPQQEKPQKSLLLSSLTSPRKEGMMSPPKMDPMLASPTENMMPGGDSTPDKFELTTDYIQETIKNALKNTDNLTPEMEEKLLSQLDGGTGLPSSTKGRVLMKGKNRVKSKPIDPATGEPMDDEWQPLSWKTKMNATKKRPDGEVEAEASSDSNNCFDVPTGAPDMSGVNASNLQTVQTPQPAPAPPRQTQTSPSTSRVVQRGTRAVKKGGTPADEKRRAAIQNKLASLLFKQKECLKKDIAKKRANLEKQLKLDIDKNVDTIKTNLKARAEMLKNSSRKRSSTDSRGVAPMTGAVSSAPRPMDSSPPPAKRKKRNEKSASNTEDDHQGGGHSLKKDKVYCICKTKYDATKFYVGCDLCSSWFHGSCIGITEKMSRGMTEYVCDECRAAKETEKIYCLCKQPYDEAQFYIGCENCHGWFHGRCVGILQAEADEIDEYLCPRCEPKSNLNYANLKKLSERDYDLIKKTLKQIQLNKNSTHFKEPVDPNLHPKYYETVKEPMDLQTVELRVTQVQYEKLAEFIGDITRIFENCRYWNAQGSNIAIAAENLEEFFSKKITLVREKVLTNK